MHRSIQKLQIKLSICDMGQKQLDIMESNKAWDYFDYQYLQDP